MKPKDRNLIVVGVTICIIIAVMAPFIASTNPDGLEKQQNKFQPMGNLEFTKHLFADYIFRFLVMVLILV